MAEPLHLRKHGPERGHRPRSETTKESVKDLHGSCLRKEAERIRPAAFRSKGEAPKAEKKFFLGSPDSGLRATESFADDSFAFFCKTVRFRNRQWFHWPRQPRPDFQVAWSTNEWSD